MDSTSQCATDAPRRHQARLNPSCIVCGSQNPKGLGIVFRTEVDGAHAEWTPSGDWESFQGVIHGGIVSTVLDEAMSKAIVSRQWEAFTVDLHVRFRGRVTPGETLLIRGWIVDKRKRLIRAESTLTTCSGQERAHAWATFLTPPAVDRTL